MSDCIPLFSVIIPLYNKEVSVSRAISSVLNQRFRGFELILVNDGSTDSSLEKVESFTDSRIRVISQFNQGVSAARNRGILESKCKYLAFLDADDEWSAEFLQEMKFLIEKVPGAGAYASGYSIQEEGGGLVRARLQGVPIEGAWGLVDFYIKSVSLGNSPVWSSAVCVPNTTFREVGMFPEGIRLYEDLHMWCRISLRFSIAYVNKALSVYHKEAENRAFVTIKHDKEYALFIDFLLELSTDNSLDMKVRFYLKKMANRYIIISSFKAKLSGAGFGALRLLWKFSITDSNDFVRFFGVGVIELLPLSFVRIIRSFVTANPR